jgi:hypothetical protein
MSHPNQIAVQIIVATEEVDFVFILRMAVMVR